MKTKHINIYLGTNPTRPSDKSGNMVKWLCNWTLCSQFLQGFRLEPPCTGVPRTSGPEIPKKSPRAFWPRVSKKCRYSSWGPDFDIFLTLFWSSRTFSTLFWHSGPEGPGKTFLRLFRDFGPRGPRESCIWGCTIRNARITILIPLEYFDVMDMESLQKNNSPRIFWCNDCVCCGRWGKRRKSDRLREIIRPEFLM